jgi:hypothetical protein
MPGKDSGAGVYESGSLVLFAGFNLPLQIVLKPNTLDQPQLSFDPIDVLFLAFEDFRQNVTGARIVNPFASCFDQVFTRGDFQIEIRAQQLLSIFTDPQTVKILN